MEVLSGPMRGSKKGKRSRRRPSKINENPKSESRNSKQARNPKHEIQNYCVIVSNIRISDFVLVSDFGFRYSNLPFSCFGFRACHISALSEDHGAAIISRHPGGSYAGLSLRM